MENELIERIAKYKRIMLNLTSDPEIFEDLIDSFYRPDRLRYREILDKLGLLLDCSLVCRYICYPVLSEEGDKFITVREECEERCRLICEEPVPDYKG